MSGRTEHRLPMVIGGFRSAAPCRDLPVNIPAMPDRNHKNEKLPVPDLAENAIIAHPVAPQPREIHFLSFSEAAWITLSGNPLIEVGDDVALRVLAELAEFLQCPVVEPIDPVHASPPRWSGF